MSGHTQGPWEAWCDNHGEYAANVEREGGERLPFDVCAGDEAIVTVYGFSEESSANARLIAAAPELLDALEEVALVLAGIIAASEDRESARLAGDPYERARAAIAKATGGAA